MEKEQLDDDFGRFLVLVTDLGHERCELKSKMHLVRCGLEKEWDKSEKKWQSLRAVGNNPAGMLRQVALELKGIYIRIYRGLLAKNSRLMEQLNNVQQMTKPESTQALEAAKKQVIEEISAIRVKLVTWGAGREIPQATDEDPICVCLKCRQDTDKQPFNLDQVEGVR